MIAPVAKWIDWLAHPAGRSPRANRGMAAVAIGLFVAGVALSHWVEPGVHVKTVTLAGDTPALQFVPADSSPHPVALLGHGITGSKENLFRFGEALAAAGFVCYAVDFPGHGASTQPFSRRANALTLEQIARALGSVDVYLGHSMGAGAGAAAVRDGGLSPKLFIAVGAIPNLGEHGPPLLLLAGQYEEFFAPAEFKSRTDARLVIAPWCDHALEPFDPLLVNTAVEAACAAVGKTPPAAPTRWRWRFFGMVLGTLGAFGLTLCLPGFPPRIAWLRGLIPPAIVIAAVALTTGTCIGAAPHLRRVPVQIAATFAVWLAIATAAKLRLPRWSFVALSVAVAIGCVIAGAGTPGTGELHHHNRFILLALLMWINTLILSVGTVLGGIAAHRGWRRDGDIAMAIFVGYAIGQGIPLPITSFLKALL
jgi:pimeloyl-ACP methyl ester carboxylesterase